MEPERCAECGFDGSRLTVGDAITALRSMRRRWGELFEDVPDDVLRKRPAPKVWSALEYAAHTRDVVAMNGWGMAKLLDGELPEVPDIPPEDEVADHGYNSLDPKAVLDELGANAERMAARAERVVGTDPWARTAASGGPDAGYVLRHAVHDASHHLKDVSKGLESLR
jgi:hypothetical protein